MLLTFRYVLNGGGLLLNKKIIGRLVLGVTLLNFIILLLFLGCTNANKHIDKPPISNPLEQYKQDIVNPINNFVFLTKEIKIDPNCVESRSSRCEALLMSTASGLVMSSDDQSVMILTAGHFCDSSGLPPSLNPTIVGIADDSPRELSMVSIDRDNDLCMLIGPKYEDEWFDDTIIAEKMPKIGDPVIAVAAPNSIGGPGLRLVFDGRFSGCTSKMCLFTIPATFGSSGGGIYNEKGELLSIVMAVTHNFENATLAPSHEALKNFISQIDAAIDIY